MGLWPMRHRIVAGLGYALGVAVYGKLPVEIPPSWTAPDRSLIWLGRPLVAFLLPTMVAVVFALHRRLRAVDVAESDDGEQARRAQDAIVFRMMLFVLGLHATVLAGLMGFGWGSGWAARIVPLMLGVTLIAIGNLLPQTRPNLVVGLRTRHTLSHRTVWIATHRLAGYITVACGLAIAVAAIGLAEPLGSRMVLLVGPMALLSIPALLVYSSRKARA